MAQDTQVRPISESSTGASRRPGWVTFAAIVSVTVGVFYALSALSEFSNSYWFYNNSITYAYNLAGSHLFWWGIFDSIIALLAIGAGISMLRAGYTGLMLGLTGASFSAIRWLFYIPATPWLAMTLIALDVLVIYGLASSFDYFMDAASERGPGF